MDDTFDYEELRAMGWTINPQTGVNRPGYVSVSFCLIIEGRKHVCLPGFGYTVTEAVADVVRSANAWIGKQEASHPLYRTLRNEPERQSA
jgi:hypothetical protein